MINIKKEFIKNGKYKLIHIELKKVKWNIHINQKAIIDNQLNINLIEATIFNFIYDFISSGCAEKIIKNDKIYYWIAYQYIIDALPILEIKDKEAIAKHIKKLEICNLLEKICIKEFGNKTFYCIGDKAKCLFFEIPTLSNQYLADEKPEAYRSKADTLTDEKPDNSYINDSNINSYNLYGELNNVKLTKDHYDKLIKDYGLKIIQEYIERLSLYDKIDKYKDHNRTIRTWLLNAKIEKIKQIKEPIPLKDQPMYEALDD